MKRLKIIEIKLFFFKKVDKIEYQNINFKLGNTESITSKVV